MPKVDTKAWKSFRLGDLFGRACHGVWVNPKLLDVSDDGLHIVSASTGDNGLSASLYVGADDKHVIPAHVITWGKQSPFFAYQVEPTISGQGVYYYNVGFLTERTVLFLCAVMQLQIAERYNYQDCLIGERCDDEVVSLPATPDGQPDWVYMDAYMSEVLKKEEVFAEHLASLTAEAVADGHKLDTSGWNVFRIGELFDIHPTRAYKRTNSELLVATGNVPVVANSAQNNGVVGFSDLPATENGGIITFSDTTDANAIFYQAQPFIGYAHVQGMYPKFQKISDFGMLFLVSAFQSQALRMNFDYANKFRRDIALNIEIYLPVTSDDQPDWAWMEQYMQQQMDKAEALVEHLDAVWG